MTTLASQIDALFPQGLPPEAEAVLPETEATAPEAEAILPALREQLRTFDGTMGFLAEQIPPVVAKLPQYPLVGQKAVKTKLLDSQEIRLAVCSMLYCLQTEGEQEARDTKEKNKAGFMSSDAWHGTKIGEALRDGEELTGEQLAWVDKHATKYSKQLTRQLARIAMKNDPMLASGLAIFSVR